MTATVVRDDDAGRTTAIEVLRGGGIVAVPTDTVYGLAVDPAAPDAIERLFQAKQRPRERAIVLLLSDAGQALGIGELGPAAATLAGAFWPGGLTIVVPRRPGASVLPGAAGPAGTIGLRVPDHPSPRAIAAALGSLPTTSANRSGQQEARDAAEIVDQFGDSIDLVLDGGPAHGGPPSTVIDCSDETPRILREGAVSAERIGAVLAADGFALVGR